MTEGYRIRSEDTWALARDDYLAGDTAEQVCARFDLGVSAFNKRARAKGWRRIDQPDPDPIDEGAVDLPEADLPALAEHALRRMDAAARRGRVAEALRWQRFHDNLAAGLDRRAEADRRAAAAARDTGDKARHAEALAHDAASRRARVAATLPRDASQYDRVRAELEDMLKHGSPAADALDEVQEVQEVQPILATPAGQAMLDRAERRRRAKAARKRS